MPRKVYKRARRNRRYRRRNMSSMTKIAPILGRTLKRKLRYVETNITLDPSIGGVPSSYVFSLNGLYDPNVTGVGHQPAGFDQLMSFYDHYTVIGAKAKVQFAQLATSDIIVGAMVKDSTTTTTDIRIPIENGQIKYKLLTRPQGGGLSHATLMVPLNISKFLGRPNPLSEDDLRGSASANPTEGAFLHIVAQANDDNEATALKCMVEIQYITVFTEPKQIALS